MTSRLLALALLAALCVPQAQARPYYAAKKGLSCAACHINPAGGGARWPWEKAPTRLNDSIALGADLRAMLQDVKGAASSYNLNESAIYLMAKPSNMITAVYENKSAATSQVYGIWKPENAPSGFYVKAGRFFVPYGM